VKKFVILLSTAECLASLKAYSSVWQST